jgi:hypothetical protein
MTLPELLDALSARDISLSIRLVIDAPQGAMTDELQRELAAHKLAIIKTLAEPVHEPVHEPAEPSPDLETETQAFMPPAGGWHRSIVWWPASRRLRWMNRARVLQAEGLRPDEAEWRAFLEAVDEINTAEAAGEKIDFLVPPDDQAEPNASCHD